MLIVNYIIHQASSTCQSENVQNKLDNAEKSFQDNVYSVGTLLPKIKTKNS